MSAATAFRQLAWSRRSSRRFQPNRMIPAETLQDILETTMRSPSSFNLQPTQIVLVQDEAVKQELADRAMLGAGNQFRTKDSAVVAFFLADLEPTKRIQRVHQLELEHRHRDPNYLATLPMVPSFLIGEGHAATLLKQLSTSFLSNVQAMPVIEPVQTWSCKNTALLAQSFVLAATSHDLATCLMEGYDGRKVQQILRVPDRYAIPLAVAMGYEYYPDNDHDDPQAQSSRRTPRLPVHEIVFQDAFGQPWKKEQSEQEDSNNDDNDKYASSQTQGDKEHMIASGR